MAVKKQFYELDEVGFVGLQGKRTAMQVKKDIALTVDFIKSKKSPVITPAPKKINRQLAKAK